MGKRRTVTPARSVGLILISCLWALFLVLSGSPEAILFTVPVFLLAAPLAFGRYFGEDLLAAIHRRRSSASSARPEFVLRPVAQPLINRLAAGEIQVRGPPIAAN